MRDKSINDLVHEQIFGHCFYQYSMGFGSICSKCGKDILRHELTINYSGSISEAWRVVEAMSVKRFFFNFGGNVISKQIGAKFYSDIQGFGNDIFRADNLEGFFAVADTLPKAICLAALEAVGVKIDCKAEKINAVTGNKK